MKHKTISLLIFILTIIFSYTLWAADIKTDELKLATTTSTDNTGLLDYLLPDFTQKTGIKVKVIAVGTGKALKYGKNGDVDVVLVHAKEAEEKFVNQGYGIKRTKVMHNYFVLLGPSHDPANVKNAKNIVQAFKLISKTKSKFVSRGDESGTHKKEKKIWTLAKIRPQGKWYIEVGQSMSASLMIANELSAYILSDKGTYFAFADKINLKPFFKKDKLLLNPYSVIAVNPEKNPHINYKGALKFIKWLVSKDTQLLIKKFKKNGKILFFPDNLK